MAKSVKKNVIAKMTLNILNVVLPLITGPYLARTLDVYLYGEYNKAFSILSWFIPFASFGIYNYGIRVISQNKNDKQKTEKIFTSLFCMGCISTVIVLIIYFMFVFLGLTKVSNTLYIVLSIQIIANIFMVEWMNEAFESYGFILFKTMAVRILNVVSIFIFVREPNDIIPYAMVVSIIALANNLLSYIHIKKNISFYKVTRADLKALIKPLLIMLLLTNANMFYTYLDKLFLSIFSEGKFVTYYTFSQSITGIITSVINAVVIVTIPRLARYVGEKRDDEYKKLLYSSSSIFFMVGIPMCIGLSILSKPIMLLYGGKNYIDAGVTMSIFAVRYILSMCDITLANQVIFIYEKESLLTRLYFIGGGINLVLNFTLVILNKVRPELLILTTLISEIFLIYMMTLCIRKDIDSSIHVLNKSTLKYFLSSLMFYPIFFVISKIMNLQYVINMHFIVTISTIVIVCIAFYIGVMIISKDAMFFQLLDTVLGKLKKRSK